MCKKSSLLNTIGFTYKHIIVISLQIWHIAQMRDFWAKSPANVQGGLIWPKLFFLVGTLEKIIHIIVWETILHYPKTVQV